MYEQTCSCGLPQFGTLVRVFPHGRALEPHAHVTSERNLQVPVVERCAASRSTLGSRPVRVFSEPVVLGARFNEGREP